MAADPKSAPQVQAGERRSERAAVPRTEKKSAPVQVPPAQDIASKQMPFSLEKTEPRASSGTESIQASSAIHACAACGQPNPKDFIFCGNCGSRIVAVVSDTIAMPSPVDKLGVKAEPRRRGRLALIKPDGSEGGEFVFTSDETIIGRGTGALFDFDPYLSPNHAQYRFVPQGVWVEDATSLNGTFFKLVEEEPLLSGDIFRVGQELLRFDTILPPQLMDDGTEVAGSPNPGFWGRLSVISELGIEGVAFPLIGEEILIGRERGDILFPDDGYVSGSHAKISMREDGFYLTDVGSSNGTFLRISKPKLLTSGTLLLMGQQLYRIEFP